MKIGLCIPVYGDTKARFTASLTSMIIWSMAREWSYNKILTKPGFTLHMSFGVSHIHAARERLAEDAIEKGVDYLLWLDADQTFPADLLYRLLKHNLPFVGCNYRQRIPSETISTASKWVDGKLIRLEPKAEGIEQVDAMGFGACLIRSDVFTALPRPWFKMDAAGEDAYFCQQAKIAGFLPCVDHALSRQVGHIAETELHF